jgi:hypothetical protein
VHRCVTVDPTTQRLFGGQGEMGGVVEVTGDFSWEALVSGEAEPAGVAMAHGRLYWINAADGQLRSADADGASPRTEWQGPNGGGCMTAHGDHLFWVNGSTGEILEHTPGDDEPRVLATGQGNLRDLAVDDDFVYFTTPNALRRLWR